VVRAQVSYVTSRKAGKKQTKDDIFKKEAEATIVKSGTLLLNISTRLIGRRLQNVLYVCATI